jgi:hypothetical protein
MESVIFLAVPELSVFALCSWTGGAWPEVPQQGEAPERCGEVAVVFMMNSFQYRRADR